MAALQFRHGGFSGFEHDPDGQPATKVSTLADERQMYALLWLCPNISSLTRALVERLEEFWDYGCAFLLDEILELQVIYRDYLGNATSTGSALGDSALLQAEDTTRIIRVLSLINLAYRPDSYHILLSRELQFKVLASSINLLSLLGTVSSSDPFVEEVRKRLVKRLDDNSKIRSAAVKDGESLLLSLGQEDFYIRWALNSLCRNSCEYPSCMLLHKNIASTFFGGDTWDDIDLTRKLGAYPIFTVDVDEETCSSQTLYELYHLASSVVSLSRYSRTLDDQDTSRIPANRSRQIAVHTVAKVEYLLQKELVRLQHQFGVREDGSHVQDKVIKSRPGEADVAFDLLHIVACLAAEFGALRCFRTIGTLCNDYVEHLPGVQTLRPLTLKAMQVLLSIKQATSGSTDSTSSGPFSALNFQLCRSPTSSARLKRKLDVSESVFMAKKKIRIRTTGHAVEDLKEHHQRTSMTPNCCESSSIVDSFRFLSPPQLKKELVKRHYQEADTMSSYQEAIGNYKSLPKEEDEYSDSLYTSQSPKSARSMVASPEPPLYSDIETPLDEYQDILKVNDLRRPDVGEEIQIEGLRKGSDYTDDSYHTIVSPLSPTGPTDNAYAINETIYELPAEPPPRSRARPQPYHGPMGSSSSSTLPDLDHSGTRSPSLPNPPITPLSPTLPSPLLIKNPWPKAVSSTSSQGSIKIRPANFQEQQVEVCPARKVKFLNSRKRADYVSLSPDCRHAAFVFNDQVQVCPGVSDWEGTGNLETEVLLKSDKKAGKFIAACLSDTHLVAISDKQIQMCSLTPLKLSATSTTVRSFNPDVCVNCLAISPKSDIIAVGQRMKAKKSDRGQPMYYAAIQLYSMGLIPEATLMCQTAGDKEFPKHISFYHDGEAMLYSNNKTFGIWKRGINGWTETPLGNLEAKGPGAKGITSITPISLSPSPTSPQPVDLPSSPLTSSHPSLRYYAVTSTLSSIAEDTASYTASTTPSPSSKSQVPWCEHLYRSAVSPDGRIAAFLTDLGRLKLASLVSRDGDPALQMRGIGSGKFQAKKEPEAHHAGRVGICSYAKGFVVIVVDRQGGVMGVRVVEAKQSGAGWGGAEGMGMAKVLGRRGVGGSVAQSICELPDNTLPIRELAAPSRFGRHS